MPRRYGIIGTIFFFFKRQEGFKTLIYNSINQISFQKSINQKKEKTHRYPWYVLDAYRKSLMLKMSKKLSVVPVSLVTLLNKIKKHRLSVTLSECTLIEDIEIFSIHHHKRISDWGEGAKLLNVSARIHIEKLVQWEHLESTRSQYDILLFSTNN
jgi:hypothetical protein